MDFHHAGWADSIMEHWRELRGWYERETVIIPMAGWFCVMTTEDRTNITVTCVCFVCFDSPF